MSRRGGRLQAGVVEGFYGPPWSHRERLDLLAAAPSLGLDTYLYAPKDDPWHRERWREPYPPDALARLGELAERAREAGVAFVWSVAPGLSMRYADDADHAALAAKAEQVRAAGVPDVWLLFDDVPDRLADPADVTRYGDGPDGAGRAHGEAAARFREAFLLPHGIDHPMTVCPTDYAGCGPSPYRAGLAETLPADARVLWTGRDIVVGEVTRDDVLAAAAAFGRRLVLWDNYPVNDFDRTRLFLGPLPGRPADVTGLPLDGVVANAMIEALPSRLPLATVGAWARDPAAYDPGRAGAEALRAVAGDRAAQVAPLVRACSSWPPSAPRDPGLTALLDGALAGDAAALAAVRGRMQELRGCAPGPLEEHPGGADAPARAADPGAPHDVAPARGRALLVALRPWLDAAAHAGAAGAAACDLLGRGDDATAEEVAAAREALDRVETDFPDVLRADVAGFVRRALAACGAVTASPVAGGRRAVLVTGPEPGAGDRATEAWLRRRGFAVEVRSTWAPGDASDLVVLTPGAPLPAARAVAASAVPVLAAGRLVTLGVARESGVLLDRDRVRTGEDEVVVHRGPGRLTWCEPVAGARVVARAPEPEPRPVLVEVATGTPLTDGTPAPAARTVTFLTGDGAARWLLTDAGWSLLDAALDRLLPGGPDAVEPAGARS
ncbi:beta-N-acetylglucosaminidase domain-containing protein [Cellulomonas sp. C5510]|uniref:beta-N-acetylglucosaminidase domain-containing protein n=1 Tax=Cellulomonas sp. C5510 TaxID=2871170 RepID=UPI002102B760|nr:beta-N-acetylglucosaminidase domain-containing protein [Cellulomonas sp. C5510]